VFELAGFRNSRTVKAKPSASTAAKPPPTRHSGIGPITALRAYHQPAGGRALSEPGPRQRYDGYVGDTRRSAKLRERGQFGEAGKIVWRRWPRDL